MGHLAEQTSPSQAALDRRSEQHAIQPADVSVFEDFQLQAFQLIEDFIVCGRGKNATSMLRVHLRRHGREGEDPLYP